MFLRPVKLAKFHSVTYIFMISSPRGVNKIRGLIGHFKQMLAQIWIKFFIKGCSKSLLLKKNSRKFQGLVLGLVGLIYAKGNSVAHSACSRDSRPRDWSRLGSFFLVSVSTIISRDSRDWGQFCFLVHGFLNNNNLLTRLTWLIHTSVLPSIWNPGKIFAPTGLLGQVHMVKQIFLKFLHAGSIFF